MGARGGYTAAKELEDALQRQISSITKRRLLKEGRDVGRKYRSTGNVDSSEQRGLRERLVHHDEGVIDEECSAEVSLQDSSYTEFVSKPVSELRVIDDESEIGGN